MSNQSFSDAYNQIVVAAEQVRQAGVACEAATAQAAAAVDRQRQRANEQIKAHTAAKDGELAQATAAAERQWQWADGQMKALAAAKTDGQAKVAAASIPLPEHAGEATLLNPPRSGLEQAVQDAKAAVIQIGTNAQLLEALRIQRMKRLKRWREMRDWAILALFLILLLWYLISAQIEARQAAETRAAAAAETRAVAAAETRAAKGWLRTITLPDGGEVTQVFVPDGAFPMGSDDGDSDEQPIHRVTLDSFWLDRSEVSNAQYSGCVAAGVCSASSYADYSSYNGPNHPVVGVSWEEAAAYCAWAGGQLPTEAQWEYAARGPEGHRFPWGEAQPSCSLSQFSDCSGGTVAVGSFSPAGDSWVGAADMAGNVWEWTQDWYDENYHDNSPVNNPSGPQSGTYKVLRGGSWYGNSLYVRAATRSVGLPAVRNDYFGFRCVVPPGP